MITKTKIPKIGAKKVEKRFAWVSMTIEKDGYRYAVWLQNYYNHYVYRKGIKVDKFLTKREEVDWYWDHYSLDGK